MWIFTFAWMGGRGWWWNYNENKVMNSAWIVWKQTAFLIRCGIMYNSVRTVNWCVKLEGWAVDKLIYLYYYFFLDTCSYPCFFHIKELEQERPCISLVSERHQTVRSWHMTKAPIISELTSVTFILDFSLMSFAASVLVALTTRSVWRQTVLFSSVTIHVASWCHLS